MRRTPILLTVLLASWVAAGPALADGVLVLEEDSPAFGADGKLVENIGFETGKGGLTPVLRAGKQCPCTRTVSYSTALDGQTEIPIRVLRGRSREVASATHLGALNVEGIKARPAGYAHVRVTLRAHEGRIEIEASHVESGTPLAVRRVDARPASQGHANEWPPPKN